MGEGDGEEKSRGAARTRTVSHRDEEDEAADLWMRYEEEKP
jgi:hypothetical protein